MDWLSYLLPFVGRIIRLKNDANEGYGDDRSNERNPSASRVRIGEAGGGSRKQHQSKLAYVPGTAVRTKLS